MNKRPTIGIMTYYAVQNFGAALQAFALQQNVERLGANAEFLRFSTNTMRVSAQQRSQPYHCYSIIENCNIIFCILHVLFV